MSPKNQSEHIATQPQIEPGPYLPGIPVYGRPEFAGSLQLGSRGILPEEPIPPDSAYQLIKGELLMDAKAGLNLATFCNEAYTDVHGTQIIADSINKNFIDHTEYPGTNLTEKRSIRIMAREFGCSFDEPDPENAPAEAAQAFYGTVTIGSSEAIMLGLIAQRFYWDQKHRVLLDNPELGIKADARDRPVVLMSSQVHGCWDKYCRYFNAVPLYVKVDAPPYAIHDGRIFSAILETQIDDPDSPYAAYIRKRLGYKAPQPGRTIGDLVMCIGTVVGTTFTGNYDNIPDIDDRVDEYCKAYNARHADIQEPFAIAYKALYHEQFGEDKDPISIPALMDIPIHVDAAAAGFVLAFSSNGAGLKFNFKDCPKRVRSINTSNHKFGMTFPGLGSVLFKNGQVVDPSLIYHIAYLGGSFDDYTVNFSRGSAMVVMQYYNFLRFGRAGYRAIMDNCVNNTQWFLTNMDADTRLSRYLKNISNIPINGEATTYLPIIALTWRDLENRPPWTLIDLSDKLAQNGWTVPAYHIPVFTPEDTNGIEVLRIVVQQVVSREKLTNLLHSLRTAIDSLDKAAKRQTIGEDVEQAIEPHVARQTACLC